MNKYDFIHSNKYIDENKIKDFIDTNVNINKKLINDFDEIYSICKHIANNKTNEEVNLLFAEELSELIKPLLKLERWNWADEFLRCEYKDIINNLYEELSDVIIMLFQFISKNDILIDKLTDEISKKLIRIYETKFGEK